MMDFYEAQSQLLEQNHLPCVERVPLAAACGRILAQDLRATQDAPLFDNSAMDGYAVCGLDTESWQIVGTSAAGDETVGALQHGQAARIYTGARLPEHTDAVVMQENAETDNGTLRVRTALISGSNIRRRGEEWRQNDLLVSAATVLSPQAVGLAASQGVAELEVFAPLRVTVLTTGNELVDVLPENALHDGQIFDSNRPMLLSMLRDQRFLAVRDGGILRDDLDATAAALRQAADISDVVVIAGGASVGDRDFVKPALEQLGEITHWKIAMKPGKPFAWGHIGRCRVMLLPGNPVAGFVTMKLLGLPALHAWAGCHPMRALPECHVARAGFEIAPNTQKRREFLRGTLHFDADGPVVKPLPQQGSHMLSGCVRATVLIDVPAQTDVHQGQWLTVYPL